MFQRNRVVEMLKATGNSFRKDELAYLALTSKIENPIRDRFAFELSQEYEDGEFIVAREWHRVDVALLGKGEIPDTLFEFKAIYSFDPLRHENKDLEPIISDFRKDSEKMKGLDFREVAYYSVLLATHPLWMNPKYSRNVVKYNNNVGSVLREHEGNPEVVAKMCEERVKKFLDEKGYPVNGSYKLIGGNSFQTEVEILSWVIGPLYAS